MYRGGYNGANLGVISDGAQELGQCRWLEGVEWEVREKDLNVGYWYFSVPMVTVDWFPLLSSTYSFSYFNTLWVNISYALTHSQIHLANTLYTVYAVVRYIVYILDR